MLEISDLHVNYAHVEAVRGVNLSAQPGKITLVLGPNGAGKTTTLKAVAGLEPPASGTVTLDGADITGLAPHAIVRRGVALVPEGRRMFGPLTVAENLRLGGYTASKSEFDDTLARVYEMFPILRERSEGASALLSGGEQQMLAFGRALMSQPKVMLLDEPTAGMNQAERQEISTLMKSMRAEGDLCQLLVEHDVQMMIDTCDYVFAMNTGQLIAEGEPREVVQNPLVQ